MNSDTSSLPVARPGFVDRHEGDAVTGPELAEFPQLRIDHHDRADETTETRSVGAEDDRHVTGEIHRADRVGVVVQVGRMESRLATVGARPFRLRADEADSGSRRVVVDFPFGGEEGVDVLIEEEIGRAVRAVENSDFPIVSKEGGSPVHPDWLNLDSP